MQVVQDNKNAILENMNPITVLDIGIISPESNDAYDFFLPFVLLDVNGKQYKFTESGLNNAFLCNGIDKWILGLPEELKILILFSVAFVIILRTECTELVNNNIVNYSIYIK